MNSNIWVLLGSMIDGNEACTNLSAFSALHRSDGIQKLSLHEYAQRCNPVVLKYCFCLEVWGCFSTRRIVLNSIQMCTLGKQM